MKNVLMVAYHYPPEGGSSGVLRTLKFSKYLPQYDWIPHVLTIKESFYPQRDFGLIKDIPQEVAVHRTLALDTARHLAIRGRYLGLFAIPDRFIGWLPFGVIKGLSVIRRFGINIIYSTSPSPTAHLIGASLKALTGIPWVVDFRDPWIEEGLHPPPGSMRYYIESALERLVIMLADQLIATTPELSEEFCRRYPNLDKTKVQFIYNGYDEEDFQGLDQSVRHDKFEIVHAGLVTSEYRNPCPLLQTVSQLIAHQRIPSDQIGITFLGGGSYVHSQEFADMVNRLGLEKVVEVSAGRIPYGETLKRLYHAGVLLVLQATDDTNCLIPAKTFEYLRIGKPILALTPNGATSDLLRAQEHCHVVNQSDQSRLSDAVLSLYTQWRRFPGGFRIVRQVSRYERSSLTGNLARVFEKVLDSRPS